MSYVAYKLIHFLGIFVMLTVLAASAMHTLGGGTRATNPHRRLLGVTHGIAAGLILTGGFGMLARLGIMHTGLPGWVYLKLVIWLLLSAAMALVYRGYARSVLIAVPVLAVAAAAIALVKPF
jgi:hypothetical protein